MSFSVIYENDDFLAVDKMAGIAVHPDKTHKQNTLIQEVIKKYPQIKGVGDDADVRPGIVHRLDKDTSGILLIAKNQEAFNFLKEKFQKKEIRKIYIALVFGKLGRKIGEEGVIDLPIARSAATPILRTAKGKMRGERKEAITKYRVIKHLKNEAGNFFTLVEAYPQTGRTHQIRVHLKAISHSVVCDRLYAGKNLKCPDGIARHFLHAFSLEFTDLRGVRIVLEAELAGDLKDFLKILHDAR